jgi:hypothetical protein
MIAKYHSLEQRLPGLEHLLGEGTIKRATSTVAERAAG